VCTVAVALLFLKVWLCAWETNTRSCERVASPVFPAWAAQRHFQNQNIPSKFLLMFPPPPPVSWKLRRSCVGPIPCVSNLESFPEYYIAQAELWSGRRQIDYSVREKEWKERKRNFTVGSVLMPTGWLTEHRLWRVLTVMCSSWDYWFLGLCPSSSILMDTTLRQLSLFVLRWERRGTRSSSWGYIRTWSLHHCCLQSCGWDGWNYLGASAHAVKWTGTQTVCNYALKTLNERI
jgi:hypothetical protein